MKKEINTNGYKYVDLDLPSGTLWATCNVGATRPEKSGLFFQWGDTVGYTGSKAAAHSTWSTTPFNWGMPDFNIDMVMLRKLIYPNSNLLPKYDAAHVHMGGDWKMPTKEQFEELIANTFSTYTNVNGVNGIKIYSKKNTNKYIFIPCIGCFLNNEQQYYNRWLELWSSTINEGFPHSAYKLYNADSDICINYYQRHLSANIRGVILNH